MSYMYYEGRRPERISRRKAYHLFVVQVDDEQKKAGTTFQSWLYDTVRAGLFVEEKGVPQW